MNRRITLAAVAVTLAAFGFSQSWLPATASLVGTYLAQGRLASTRHVLTLNGDLSATLRADNWNSSRPAVEKGSWIINGPSVQVSLLGEDEVATLVLTLVDGLLVVTGGERRDDLAGLVFERTTEAPLATEPAEH